MYTCGTGFDGYANQLQTTKEEGGARPVNAQGELGRKVATSTALMPGGVLAFLQVLRELQQEPRSWRMQCMACCHIASPASLVPYLTEARSRAELSLCSQGSSENQ